MECIMCTFINEAGSTACSMCGTTMAKRRKLGESATPPPSGSSAVEWACSECTCLNPIQSIACEACGAEMFSTTPTTARKAFQQKLLVCSECDSTFSSIELLVEHEDLHAAVKLSAEASTTVEFETDDEPQQAIIGGYFAQYEEGIKKALAQNKVGKMWMEKKLKEVRENPRAADTDTRTCGLIANLRAFFAEQQDRTALLCNDTDFFASSWGDRGWGCGFRNIQNVSSALIKNSYLSKAMYGGCGFVPVIPCVQEWLESAWNSGIDPQGRAQIGSAYNRRVWIGTHEAASLFRSFGIKATVHDFYSEPKKGVLNDRGEQVYLPNKALLQWVWDYFDKQTKANPTFVMPLYFQHSGHSRTIVGIEKHKNDLNLLLFDPSVWGKTLPADIANGKLTRIRRTARSLTQKEYQILAITSPK